MHPGVAQLVALGAEASLGSAFSGLTSPGAGAASGRPFFFTHASVQ